MRCRPGFHPGGLSDAILRWALLFFLVPVMFVSEINCTRHKAISRPPRISEREKNERVFQTNEEAVKAGIYEEFVDSMLLKGLPGQAVPAESTPRAETPTSKPVDVPGVPGAVAPEVVMGFRVQLGAFTEQEGAERFADNARERLVSYPVYVRYYHPLWKVQAGDCPTREEAERLRNILSGRGYPDAWVVQSGINR
jgi:cell division septation protein DedD